ncbi:hypothetical protein phiOC_p079 [Ochrobactrum phage vB_OspM_OC]|nr:hypothetical protein phiOC_p079 [Ochrobactrum phage vB_OspM_OC]
MAFATNEDRLEIINGTDYDLPFVVRIRTWCGESELSADDFDHAYNLAMDWKLMHKADYVEIFRVDQKDGSLYGGIGEL